MFSKLFGKEPPMRDIAALAEPHSATAVQLVKTVQPTRSFIGGRPNVAEGFIWPSFKGRPMDFIAQLDLEGLQATLAHDWLPKTGTLLFFYDMEAGTWGFDPEDRGSAAVIHTTGRADALVHLGKAEADAIRKNGVTFRCFETLPTWERNEVAALELTDAESDRWIGISVDQYRGEPHHQVGGYPDPVQGDAMELECALVTNGLYCGDSSGYHDRRAKALEATAGEWKLLLQIDTDDGLNMMWGDCGRLYFWVQEGQARIDDFSNTWLILQCS